MTIPERALVTGAGGFVGANLCRLLLREGHEVYALVRGDGLPWRLAGIEDDIHVHLIDITRDWQVDMALRAIRPAWVFHLAAHGAYPHQRDEQAIINVNTAGFRNVVRASMKAGVAAFINAGTSSEYGPKDHAPTEDEGCAPQGWYAKSKLWATGYLRRPRDMRALPSRTLRLYSVYGPWEEPSRLMAQVVAKGLSFDLPPFADPETARDFVYVEDVCRAFLRAAETIADEGEPGAIYNIGTGIERTLRDVAGQAKELFKVRDHEPIFNAYPARPHDTTTWVANPTRARRFWESHTSLTSGLARTALWLRERPELWGRYGVDLPGT